MAFRPEYFLTYGSVVAAGVAIGSAIAARISAKASTTSVKQPDGSTITITAKGGTIKDVKQLIAALDTTSGTHNE